MIFDVIRKSRDKDPAELVFSFFMSMDGTGSELIVSVLNALEPQDMLEHPSAVIAVFASSKHRASRDEALKEVYREAHGRMKHPFKDAFKDLDWWSKFQI